MPLNPIPVSADSAAENLVRQMVDQVTATAQRIIQVRTNGVAAQPETAARQLPDGRVIPARPGQPAISPAKIEEILAASGNDVVFDALAKALK